MQKKIIALAVAAAFSAPAFADVSLYGVVDAAVTSVSGSGQKSDLLALSGGLSASRFGVKVTEGLDNGLTAVAVLEYGMDTQVNSTIGTTGAGALNARQQMLAVAGSFGTVATGYLQTAGYDFAVKYDPTAGSAVSPLQNVTAGGGFFIGSAAAAARAPRAVAYISPDFNGLTFAANYSTEVTGGLGNAGQASTITVDNKTSAYLFSANYANGPLSVGGVYLGATAGTSLIPALTATIDVKEYSIGGSYDLGVAKLTGTYQSNKTGAASAVTAYSFGVVAPVGPGAVAASYAGNKMTAANSNGSGFTVGYLYGLSKTTTAYVALNRMSNGSATNAFSVAGNALSNANLTAGGSSTLLALGLNKKF